MFLRLVGARRGGVALLCAASWALGAIVASCAPDAVFEGAAGGAGGTTHASAGGHASTSAGGACGDGGHPETCNFTDDNADGDVDENDPWSFGPPIQIYPVGNVSPCDCLPADVGAVAAGYWELTDKLAFVLGDRTNGVVVLTHSDGTAPTAICQDVHEAVTHTSLAFDASHGLCGLVDVGDAPPWTFFRNSSDPHLEGPATQLTIAGSELVRGFDVAFDSMALSDQSNPTYVVAVADGSQAYVGWIDGHNAITETHVNVGPAAAVTNGMALGAYGSSIAYAVESDASPPAIELGLINQGTREQFVKHLGGSLAKHGGIGWIDASNLWFSFLGPQGAKMQSLPIDESPGASALLTGSNAPWGVAPLGASFVVALEPEAAAVDLVRVGSTLAFTPGASPGSCGNPHLAGVRDAVPIVITSSPPRVALVTVAPDGTSVSVRFAKCGL